MFTVSKANEVSNYVDTEGLDRIEDQLHQLERRVDRALLFISRSRGIDTGTAMAIVRDILIVG
jgi:hypothetical protein